MNEAAKARGRRIRRRSADPGWRKRYAEHEGEISLLMSHLTLQYLRMINRAFEGDFALTLVLGEIAHHTVVEYFSSHGRTAASPGSLTWNSMGYERLKSCSATALARATGLPRETVRRKILVLEQRGWIERTADRRVRITQTVATAFLRGFNVDLVEAFLDTTDAIRKLLRE